MIVVVLLMVLVTWALAMLCGMKTVVGSAVTMLVVVVLTVTSTRQSTRCGWTRSRLDVEPSRLTWKPPVFPLAVWRLRMLTPTLFSAYERRLMRAVGIGVGLAMSTRRSGRKALGVGIVVAGGVVVVVVETTSVVRTISVQVVAAGVMETVFLVVYVM